MLEGTVNLVSVFGIAFVGGLAGAFAKHVFSFVTKRVDYRVKNREILETLLEKYIEEVRILSTSYWSVDESEDQKAVGARIVAICDSIPGLYIQLFDRNENVTRELDIKLNRLTRVITGGSFQQSDRAADHGVISEMETCLMDLLIEILLQKAQLKYPWT